MGSVRVQVGGREDGGGRGFVILTPKRKRKGYTSAR